MCGIVGLLNIFENREIDLQNMLNAIFHRGPDDEGTFFDNQFAGGMRRLSINDVDNGSQPLLNSDKSIVLFYNGEIYNYPQLRNELESEGVRFRTRSDGEVLVHLYEKIGEKVFERLDGMFAAAIWDTRTQTLTLGRDIPGEKPLFYSRDSNGRLAFASEIKALRNVSSINLTLNKQSLWDFPSFLWIPDPVTIFNEIEALPRGHILVANKDKISIRPYRNLFTPPDFDLSKDDEVISAVRNVVEKAVTSRLLSDVPIGSFLSGGLDSSIVACIAARELPQLDTFTVSFEDVIDPYHGRADESVAAAETASIIGSRHHTIRVNADIFRKSLDDFCKFGDQPFAVSSGLGIMAISAAAKEAGIKVLLTGDGADECFGGYSWYAHLNETVRSEINLQENPFSFQNFGSSLKDRLNILGQMTPSLRAWAWHYYAHEDEKKKLFSEDWQDGLNSSLRYFESLENSAEPIDFIRHDRNFYFPFEMLRKVDRMGMANSVEGRTPFAAPSVLSLSERLDYGHMVRDKDLKWVLRRAFEDIVPMQVVNRPKHGFNVPIDHWLKNEWSDLVEETFSKGSLLHQQNIISDNAISIAHEMLSDKQRLNGHTIFCFIMLNKWLST
jgi:asparagine synthase (glutamine-hydrolysing)